MHPGKRLIIFKCYSILLKSLIVKETIIQEYVILEVTVNCHSFQLLKRVFDIIREKNPDMVTGEKKKIVMRPPQVLRAGARKTSFANFSEICRM